MKRFVAGILLSIAIGLLPASSAAAQSPSIPSSLKFEVATLKPTPPGARGGGIRPAPGGERYLATNMSPKAMLTTAYRIKDVQITGDPSWMDTDHYDMNAKAEKPSTVEELHVMLRNLLAEQFKLQLHQESKELPVYALSVEKPNPKLQPHEAQSAGDPWIDIDGKMLRSPCMPNLFPWIISSGVSRRSWIGLS